MNVLPQVRNFIESRDHRIMRRVHSWTPPHWVRLWMTVATRCGDGWLWSALAMIILTVGAENRFLAIESSTAAATTGILFFIWVKRATGRRRPCDIAPHCWSTLLPPDQFSFPSGHTITAFAIITPLLALYPEHAFALSFCALSIASSRIILGMHFLSDVIAGASIGTILGISSLRLLR